MLNQVMERWVLTATWQNYADPIVIFWLCKVLIPHFARARITNVSPLNFALGFELDEPWSTETLAQLHIVKGMLLRDADSTVTVINVPGRYSWIFDIVQLLQHTQQAGVQNRCTAVICHASISSVQSLASCDGSEHKCLWVLYNSPQQHTTHRCPWPKKNKNNVTAAWIE